MTKDAKVNVLNGLSSEDFALSIQLGLRHAIGMTHRDPLEDVLVEDIKEVEELYLPSNGSSTTMPHSYPDFYFVHYASKAFRYFRKLYRIEPEDYMVSLCNKPLKLISNPGASGSIFFISSDDCFIIKTVQPKEAKFLRNLLNQYFFNLAQNPISMMPKIFGLYTYKSSIVKRSVRFVVMNNLLPSYLDIHLKFDLKGSTYKRYASVEERKKRSPTYKDLDFFVMDTNEVLDRANAWVAGHAGAGDQQGGQDKEDKEEREDVKEKEKIGSEYLSQQRHLNPNFYIKLPEELFAQYRKTLVKDVRVLTSCKIMDYSMLVGIHFLTEKSIGKILRHNNLLEETNVNQFTFNDMFTSEFSRISLNGGYLAYTNDGRPILLFLGIIDILQQYKLFKKSEHLVKSMFVKDGIRAVSVCPPSAYGRRFLEMLNGNAIRSATMSEIESFAAMNLKSSNMSGHESLSSLSLELNSRPVSRAESAYGHEFTHSETDEPETPDEAVAGSAKAGESKPEGGEHVRVCAGPENTENNPNKQNSDLQEPLADRDAAESPQQASTPKSRIISVHMGGDSGEAALRGANMDKRESTRIKTNQDLVQLLHNNSQQIKKKDTSPLH